jgi:hypothetical protein
MGIRSLQQFSKSIKGNKNLLPLKVRLDVDVDNGVAVNGTDNLASDRSSQLALRVNRNLGGAFMGDREQSARIPLRVSLLRGRMLSVLARSGFSKRAR